MIINNDEKKIYAFIPATKIHLAELEQKFLDYQKQREGLGYKKPEQWPKDMLNERLATEAKLDILNEELAVLNKWLEEVPIPLGHPDEIAPILPRGPVCSGHLDWMGERLKEMDGQTVDYIGDTLCIVDQRSPYFSMAIADYRVMADTWKMERAKAHQLKEQKLRDEARAAGKRVPNLPMSNKVDRSSWPKWPEGVEVHRVEAKKAKEAVS
jgi:hypothetical protein